MKTAALASPSSIGRRTMPVSSITDSADIGGADKCKLTNKSSANTPMNYTDFARKYCKI
jgi:hypothetical protein